jgi:hypothetical protein
MPLSDLTSPAAVEAALDEFDTVGREAFLTKYGVGTGAGSHAAKCDPLDRRRGLSSAGQRRSWQPGRDPVGLGAAARPQGRE